MKEKYYLTTAIAYTSGKPHIGNTYEAILADSVARFKRYQDFDVFFQTGTDEHGQKIEEKAAAVGVSPKEFVDSVAKEIQSIWDLVGVSYDKFIRTTDDYHEKQVQKIFKKLYEKGDIYKGSYEGWYCTPCESFWTESQLVDGKCPDCGREVKKSQEEAYFFKMSKYADRLMQYYEEHPEFILPVSRKNEMVNNFLKPGLQDLCVSRSTFKWGVPVDFDAKHVVYVWLDALTNYITGIGYDADGNDSELYNKLWPADVHIIGKDIIRFHTIYWPIFLMALDIPLPKKVYGHGWLLQDGGKMSKSKGNVIYADDLVEYFGKDAVRYYVLTAMPQDNDGLISWESVIDTINSDLANVFGNLVSRTIAMSNKYFNGFVCDGKVSEAVDEELKLVATSAYQKVASKMDDFKIADAISEIFNVFRRANKYIDETMPWKLIKEDKERLQTVMYNLSETIRICALMLKPFLTKTSGKILEIFGQDDIDLYGESVKYGNLKTGVNVIVGDKLFPRIDVAKELEFLASYVESLKKPMKEEKKVEIAKKEEITIDDFAKVQLITAKVIACEKVEKADKLLKLTVKTFDGERTVVSGIAKHYKPEEMVGKVVVLVANLKKVKLRGIESEGMILCAENEKGELSLVSPEKPFGEGLEVR